MAIQFLPMPRPGDGVSSLLDFSPLAASLQNYTRGNDMATQRQNMQQVGQTFADQGASAAGKQALSMGELDTGMQLNQQASADKDRQVKVLGAVAKAAKFEQDPQRRAMLWQAGLKRAGVNPQDLDPEELDPMTGPDVFMAAAGMAEDPLDRRLKQAQIQKALRPDSGSDAPKAWQEWQNFNQLSEEDQRRYLSMKRADPTDRLFAKTYESDVASGGLYDQAKNIEQLRGVRDRLKTGKENLTGPIVGNVPDAIGAFTNPAAIDTREQVEEVVQRNLRQILGAQFTQKEGERLIARAYNPALEEKENAKRLDRLVTAMEKAYEAKQGAADYFQKFGTLRGYQGPTEFSIQDFERAVDGQGFEETQTSNQPAQNQPAAPSAPPPVQGARQAPDGFFYIPDPNRPGKYLRVE